MARPRVEGGTPEQIRARERERAKYTARHHTRVAASVALRETSATEKAASTTRKKTPSMSKPLPEVRPLAQVARWPSDSIIRPPTLQQLMSGR